MNTTRKGIIGEAYTKIDLLKRGLYPHKPMVDDDGVDFMVENKEQNKTFTLQVKLSNRYDSYNSVWFDIKKSRADWVCLVHELKQPNGLVTPVIMYMKNKRINKRWTINIRMEGKSKNMQEKLINSWDSFINPKF